MGSVSPTPWVPPVGDEPDSAPAFCAPEPVASCCRTWCLPGPQGSVANPSHTPALVGGGGLRGHVVGNK